MSLFLPLCATGLFWENSGKRKTKLRPNLTLEEVERVFYCLRYLSVSAELSDIPTSQSGVSGRWREKVEVKTDKRALVNALTMQTWLAGKL